MQIDEFKLAVRQMRYYQKLYQGTRDSHALEAAKKAEAKVDEELNKVFEPTLF